MEKKTGLKENRNARRKKKVSGGEKEGTDRSRSHSNPE